MIALFHSFIYQPIYNILVFCYDILPGSDFGIAIIATTLLLKLIFIPLSKKQIESQKKMQEMQPKIKEIQQRNKQDKEKQTREMMEFYKTNKVNPFSGCLPLIVQFVFLIAIYRVIINISNAGFVVNPIDLYAFVIAPESINHFFLGVVDLTRPNYILAFLSALAQYFQTKMLFRSSSVKSAPKGTSSEPDFASIMNKQMLYIGPALTFYIGVTFPAALALYWLFSTLFMLFQQMYIIKPSMKA